MRSDVVIASRMVHRHPARRLVEGPVVSLNKQLDALALIAGSFDHD